MRCSKNNVGKIASLALVYANVSNGVWPYLKTIHTHIPVKLKSSVDTTENALIFDAED